MTCEYRTGQGGGDIHPSGAKPGSKKGARTRNNGQHEAHFTMLAKRCKVRELHVHKDDCSDVTLSSNALQHGKVCKIFDPSSSIHDATLGVSETTSMNPLSFFKCAIERRPTSGRLYWETIEAVFDSLCRKVIFLTLNENRKMSLLIYVHPRP